MPRYADTIPEFTRIELDVDPTKDIRVSHTRQILVSQVLPDKKVPIYSGYDRSMPICVVGGRIEVKTYDVPSFVAIEEGQGNFQPVILTADNGVLPGRQVCATGGVTATYSLDGDVIVLDGDTFEDHVYRLLINGVAPANPYFIGCRTLPDTVLPGDLITVEDIDGNVSNTLVVEDWMPTISGFAYPANTLTSDFPGQWRINGVATGPPTARSLLLPITSIGKIVTCGTSDPVTVWHPRNDVEFYLIATEGVWSSVSPNVLATGGQPVRSWGSNRIPGGSDENDPLVSNSTANQQPIYRSSGVNGLPSLEFDATNDILERTSGPMLVVSNAKERITLFVAVTPTTSSTSVYAQIMNSSGNAMCDLVKTSNRFRARGRRTNADGLTTLTDNNTADPLASHVLTNVSDYSSGQVTLRIDGLINNTGSYISAGLTSAANAQSITVGSATSGAGGHIQFVAFTNSNLTPQAISRIERFAGLLCGKNIPLVP